MTGFQRVFTESFKLESNSKDESVTSEELKKNKESWSVACQDVTEFKNDLTNLIGEDVKKTAGIDFDAFIAAFIAKSGKDLKVK